MATTNINVYAPKSEKTEVSVTQTQTSGAEIGSVTVDGTETKLYAPEASSVGVTRHILFYNGNWSTYKDEVISKLRELCDSISIGGVRLSLIHI